MKTALLIMTLATSIALTACERHKDPVHTDSTDTANGPSMTANGTGTTSADPSVTPASSSSDDSMSSSSSSSVTP